MFNDTITLGVEPAIVFTRRASRGTREIFVPSGDTPSNERRLELGHEVTSAKRVNSLVKVAIVRPHPITGVLEEASIQTKYVHPASFTLAEMLELNTLSTGFHSETVNATKVFNQET